MIHRSAKEAEFLVRLPQADSLEEFLADLGTNLAERSPRVADGINWVMLRFPTLPDEEKRTVQNQVLANQRALKDQISRYVANDETTERLAWLVTCSFLGYQRMFTRPELAGMVDLSTAEFAGVLAQIIDRGL